MMAAPQPKAMSRYVAFVCVTLPTAAMAVTCALLGEVELVIEMRTVTFWLVNGAVNRRS